MDNRFRSLFFEKVNTNYEIKEELELLKKSFDTLYCDVDEIVILLDSKGVFLASKNTNKLEYENQKFKYINKIDNNTKVFTVDNNTIQIAKFNEIQSDISFYIIIHPKNHTEIEIESLGNSLIKIYLLANSYRIQHNRILMYLDAIQEGISAVDKDGILIYANKMCYSILGTNKQEVLNISADKLCKNRPLLFDILRSKQSKIDSEYFLEYKDKMVHLTSSGYPVFDENGNLQGAIDIFKSINRSRKLANMIAGNNATFEFDNIIGSGSQTKATKEIAQKCAIYNENILIEGESGTGKELFAQAIHNHSNKSKGPFIAVNCANLPNELVESELFGYEEGTFTGAKKGGKAGKFELADSGTLFLDEIGEMPIHLQAKFLRAVEYKTIYRIGSDRPIKVDVRIIAATNRSLESMVDKGSFRGDLYFRLKVLYLRIPPLRERSEDIIELANFFMEKTAFEMKKKIEDFDDDAKKLLLSYNWPGNIRELENSIARAIFLCDGTIVKKEHLVKAGIICDRIELEAISGKNSINALKYAYVKEVYESVGGNKKKAAEILGISRPTLYKLVKVYNISKS